MPRLFLKLFGTFWLTTVLILAVSIFASFRLADDSASGVRIDPREADELMRDELAEGGIQGLRNWIANSSNFPPGQTVYVVDEAGSEILGRAVPEMLRRQLERMWRFSERHEMGESRRDHQGHAHRNFTAILVAQDGKRWLSMPGPAPPPRFGVFSRGDMRWIVFVLAAATSLISFWLLSRSLSQPARCISSAVNRLAAGDLSARVGKAGYSNDEIGEIARQFDRMASELEAQANSRRELFRNVSHEMRAPLARLQIATELLQRKPDEKEVQLRRIQEEIGVLENLTAQVLALARASQEKPIDKVADMAAVIERVAENAQLEASEKKVRLEWHPPGSILVPADEVLVVSAIENVVRNAVQAAPAGGRVALEVAGDDDTCVVSVTDDGPGVPDSEFERIFEPFYRLDTNRPGSGIGLAITARVLNQLGGSARAQRAGEGGLKVTLAFPRHHG